MPVKNRSHAMAIFALYRKFGFAEFAGLTAIMKVDPDLLLESLQFDEVYKSAIAHEKKLLADLEELRRLMRKSRRLKRKETVK